MLPIVNLEEIEGLLLRIPGLIDRQEERSSSFVDDVRQWLKELEAALESNRMSVAGRVATLRGLLSSAEQGLNPPNVDFRGQPTRRKILSAVSSEALRRAGQMVSDAIQPDRARYEEAERVCRQLVAHGRVRSLVSEDRSVVDPTEYLRGTWQKLSGNADLSQHVTHLVGLLGPRDVLVVLDRILTADSPGWTHPGAVTRDG